MTGPSPAKVAAAVLAAAAEAAEEALLTSINAHNGDGVCTFVRTGKRYTKQTFHYCYSRECDCSCDVLL
jgi:hypothetical protein